MKDDIRKYLPDLATVLRESEPAVIKAQKEKAIQSFKEAQGTPEEDGAHDAAQDAAPESSPRLVRAAPSNDAPATASPWASSAAAVVPKEALPSALAPAATAPRAAAPATATAAPATIGADAGKRRKLPRWALPVLAVLAVVVPLVLLWFVMRPKAPSPHGASAVPAGSSSIEEGPAPPNATVKGAPSASSSFIEEGPAPSAVPTVSATAPEPPVSATGKAAVTPAGPKMPKDAAPSTTSAPSAHPTAAPTVPPAPSGPPPIKAEPFEGEREFGR